MIKQEKEDLIRTYIPRFIHIFRQTNIMYFDPSVELKMQEMAFRNERLPHWIYGNALRKIYLLIFLQLIKKSLIGISIEEMMEFKIPIFREFRQISGWDGIGNVFHKIRDKMMSEYGYIMSFHTYDAGLFFRKSDVAAFDDTDIVRQGLMDSLWEEDFNVIELNIEGLQEEYINAREVFDLEKFSIYSYIHRDISKYLSAEKVEHLDKDDENIMNAIYELNGNMNSSTLFVPDAEFDSDGEYVMHDIACFMAIKEYGEVIKVLPVDGRFVNYGFLFNIMYLDTLLKKDC